MAAQKAMVDACPVWKAAKWSLCGSYGGISPRLSHFPVSLKGPTRAIFCSINTSLAFQCAETTSFGLGVTERVSSRDGQGAFERLREAEEKRKR